jgi:hypothetical protein
MPNNIGRLKNFVLYNFPAEEDEEHMHMRWNGDLYLYAIFTTFSTKEDNLSDLHPKFAFPITLTD